MTGAFSVDDSCLPFVIGFLSGRVIRCEDEGQWREDSERERAGGEMGQLRGRPRGGVVGGGGGGERDYRRFGVAVLNFANTCSWYKVAGGEDFF
ncbi:unnamed protein product [Hydatigera taeniaeformis]|uniref:Uncharacterized protein n=1 Tax=Hydatigena taeniaeformis TaxID=6205 RepID=A0A0R3WYF8_HYDTA|nr:unnamed protein product [Hydatigera taeniaeformis]